MNTALFPRVIFGTVLAWWVVLGVAQAGPAPTASNGGTVSASPIAARDQARIDAARKTFTLTQVEYGQGTGTREDLYTWSLRLYRAEHDAGVKNAAVDHLARMSALKAIVVVGYKNGAVSARDLAAAEYYVADAEALK